MNCKPINSYFPKIFRFTWQQFTYITFTDLYAYTARVKSDVTADTMPHCLHSIFTFFSSSSKEYSILCFKHCPVEGNHSNKPPIRVKRSKYLISTTQLWIEIHMEDFLFLPTLKLSSYSSFYQRYKRPRTASRGKINHLKKH